MPPTPLGPGAGEDLSGGGWQSTRAPLFLETEDGSGDPPLQIHRRTGGRRVGRQMER